MKISSTTKSVYYYAKDMSLIELDMSIFSVACGKFTSSVPKKG